MKKLILILIVLASTQSWAMDTTNQLIPQQELKLLKLLQQMEPEALEELLSDTGIQWFIENSQRFEVKTLSEDKSDSLIQPTILDYAEMKDDKNAPKFN